MYFFYNSWLYLVVLGWNSSAVRWGGERNVSTLNCFAYMKKCSTKRSLNILITRLNPQPLPWHGLDILFAGLSQDPRVPRWRSHQQWLLGLVRFLARFRLNILYHLLRLHSLLNIWKWFDLSCEKKTPLFMQKSDRSSLFTLTLSLTAVCFVS